MELGCRQGDGATLRTHLQRLAQNTSRVDDRLLEEVPRSLRYLWDAFTDLGAKRRAGMGASPLTFVDIESWSRLYGVRLNPWELDTLIQLDVVTLNKAAEQQANQRN